MPLTFPQTASVYLPRVVRYGPEDRTRNADEGKGHIAMADTGIAELIMVTLDCARPAEQARFYGELLGWDVLHSQDEYAMIGNGAASIGFGQVAGYTPPSWPDTEGGKRYHIDTYVDDLDAAEAACVKLGATKPDFQPGETWRVMLDPEGQPFCICQRR